MASVDVKHHNNQRALTWLAGSEAVLTWLAGSEAILERNGLVTELPKHSTDSSNALDPQVFCPGGLTGR